MMDLGVLLEFWEAWQVMKQEAMYNSTSPLISQNLSKMVYNEASRSIWGVIASILGLVECIGMANSLHLQYSNE